MEVRCVQCRQIFAAPATATGEEMACPGCGGLNQIRAPAPAAAPHPAHHHPHHAPHDLDDRGEMERIFNPFPKPVLYLFGAILLLAISAPFWLGDFMDRFKDEELLFTDELEGLADTPPSPLGPSLPAPPNPTAEFDNYAGIRLDATREALQDRFNLRLKNTRGMQPEIYEATDVPRVELATFHFYGNELKEFTLIHAEQRATPLVIVRELRELLGEASDWTDAETALPPPVGSGRVAPTGTTDLAELLAARLRRYPYRQEVIWREADARLAATVYYTSKTPLDCLATLSIHVSAHAWLTARSAQTSGLAQPPPIEAPALPALPGLPETPLTPLPPANDEPPRRLFP